MAYGRTMARGVIGETSPQAKGKRLGASPGSTPEMQDVSLSKWPDHEKVLSDMAQKLAEAKDAYLNESDPTNAEALKRAWKKGLDSYKDVSAQLQAQRNIAQAQFQEAVKEINSGMFEGDSSLEYSKAAEYYRQLRSGGNIELSSSWEIGEDPIFNTRAQKTVALAGVPGNYSIEGWQDMQTDVTLDASNYYLKTGDFKFFGSGHSATDGVTTPAVTEPEAAVIETPTATTAVEETTENAVGGVTGRKKYDIDGNRIA